MIIYLNFINNSFAYGCFSCQAKVDVAKEKIYDAGKSVSEIAYELGFKYPQHFTRFFKQQVGSTPNGYRSLLN